MSEEKNNGEIVAVRSQEVFQFMGVTSAQEIESRQKLQQQILVAAMAQTMPHDWINFENEPYLEGSGAERIARFCGLSFAEYEVNAEVKPNGHIYCEVIGKIRAGEREIIEIGDCSSDDRFFWRDKEPQEPAVVNRADVKKKAIQNWKTRAVTSFLGLRGLRWEDLSQLTNGRICAEKSGGGVKFDKGKHGGSRETTEQRNARVSDKNAELENYENQVSIIQLALTTAQSFDISEEEFVKSVSEYNGKRYNTMQEMMKACGEAFEKFKNCKLIAGIASKAKKYADDVKAKASEPF